MNKTLFFIALVAIITATSCNNNSGKNEQASNADSINLNTENPVVLIYNFYGTHRCPSCIAIEEATTKTLDSCFSGQVKSGIIKRYSVNIDEEANAKICEKYQAFGSGIFVTQVLKGKEKTTDLTGSGFKFALHKKEKFIEILKLTIDSLLKQ